MADRNEFYVGRKCRLAIVLGPRHLGIAVTAGLLALTVPAVTAKSAVITRNVNKVLLATPDGPDNTYDLDINLDGVTDFKFTTIIGIPEDPTFASFSTIDHPFGTSNAYLIDATTGDGFPTVSRLAAGATVGSSSLFSGPNDQGNLFFVAFPDAPTGNFQNQSGYVGFRFGDASNNTLYGFASVKVNDLLAPTDPLSVTIGQVGYESVPGTPVTIPVPEPASLAGVALLLIADLGRRRRR